MKKLIFGLLIIAIMISTVGCAELINTEYKTVDVKIVDSYHKGAWSQPIISGKAITFIHHPAKYTIDVEYNDVKYSIHGSDTYYTYKDKVGEIVPGTLRIRTYDDGSTKYDITALGISN